MDAILGISSMRPSDSISVRALPKAEVFPRFPAGSTIQSGGSQPLCWMSSKTIDFCPSILQGFTEFRR